MEAEYLIALSTGFLGGFGHCIGMCGPVIASCTIHQSAPLITGRCIPHVLYNAGRITTYMFIGAVMGLTGSFINVAGSMSGFQNAVALIAGLLMVIMGMNITGLIGRTGWLDHHGGFVIKAGTQLLHENSLWRYLPLGALFGFLPCGLSYAAFMAAAGTGSLLRGMLLLLFFGLGTVPALLLFGVTASWISMKMKGALYKTAGIAVIMMGIMYLYRATKMMIWA
ncbi:MAG: sulfite exporter TauE/SafE family protein [Nitrospiraceae bacterium]|nr:MAG: sulfite exporter TauE/SafE family protein [Nitrospiraceae bacterium]